MVGDLKKVCSVGSPRWCNPSRMYSNNIQLGHNGCSRCGVSPSEVQSPALFLGILEVLGGISFLLVGLSIKQHIKRQVDEKELLMTMCLSAGVMFGILEVMMKAGPRRCLAPKT